jgi:hypothetical protein
MPLCTCGCNQNLSRRAVNNHVKGRAAPRLITLVVKAHRAHGRAVSPPRLNPPKKLRSSRRYFPSSPASATAHDEPDFPMSNAAGDGDASDEEESFLDEAGAQRAINAALEDIWSGWHHYNDDTGAESDDDGGEGGEGEDAEAGWDDDEYENENELSALDILGEDFERNSVANGK